MVMLWWSLSFILIIFSFELGVAERRRCASCNPRQFEEFKMMRQEQILDDLLSKLELVSKPNVTVDYNNLPPVGRASPKVKQMIEKSIQEKKQRYRRGISSSPSFTEGEYYPSLYETDAEISTQISFIKSTPAPFNLQDFGEMALFNFSGNFYSKIVTDATLHIFVRAPDTLNRDDAMSIRVNIYEKFLNGTIGDKIATKHIHLHGYSIPYGVFKVHLDTFDVQRWLRNRSDGNDILGIYVEALHNGENLAIHPASSETDVCCLNFFVVCHQTINNHNYRQCFWNLNLLMEAPAVNVPQISVKLEQMKLNVVYMI
jgi:hypothetical protein